MSMSEKTQRTGRAVNIAEKEQATQWLSSRPGYKPLLDNIIDFLNLHYRGSNKGWVNDGNAKFKFGPSNQNGRISIDPRPSKNGINVRFGVSVSNIPDYFRSKDLPQSLKPEICFNESRSYYDILLPLAGRNNEEFEAIKSFLKAGICDGFVYTQENDELYNEIQEQTSEEDKLTYVRSAISEKICKRKEQQMERKFVSWYKSNHPESDITQQYSDINFIRDVVIKIDSKVITAELKYKRTALEEIEAAVAQLLRYGFYPDVEPSDEFWIVGSSKPTKEDTLWFQKLKENLWFELQYYYLNEDQKNFIKVS